MQEKTRLKSDKKNSVKAKKVRKNLDSPWKEALAIFFKEFVFFCFPDMAKEIDWSKGYTSLDKELHAITKDSATGQRTVDKIIKVFKKTVGEVWVLIHVEIQGKLDPQFSERMYTYQYRLFDRYRVPVVSIAILIDGNKNWLPSQYHTALWGTQCLFKYRVLKVLSYKNKRALLERSLNPFATVLLAQLEVMALSKNPDIQHHLVSKLALTRLLYEKGWKRDAVCHLYRFIDWLIQLPEELVIKYDNEIHKIEEIKKMTYVTSIERLGIERGKIIGEEIGEAKIVQNLYRSIKDVQKVATLCRLSLKKVRAIIGQEKLR